jgi:hypothetical protein
MVGRAQCAEASYTTFFFLLVYVLRAYILSLMYIRYITCLTIAIVVQLMNKTIR